MNTQTRKQLERASRIALFCRERPADLPGYQPAVSRLEDRLARAGNLAGEATASRLAGKAAIAERHELRKRIVADLQMLAGIARTAGVESVGTPIVIRYPGPRRNQVQFLSGARVAVQSAREQEELLIKYGLPPGQLQQLSARLDQFASLLDRRDHAIQGRLGAGR